MNDLSVYTEFKNGYLYVIFIDDRQTYILRKHSTEINVYSLIVGTNLYYVDFQLNWEYMNNRLVFKDERHKVWWTKQEYHIESHESLPKSYGRVFWNALIKKGFRVHR
jgi:hypothetical protein